LMDVPLR